MEEVLFEFHIIKLDRSKCLNWQFCASNGITISPKCKNSICCTKQISIPRIVGIDLLCEKYILHLSISEGINGQVPGKYCLTRYIF